MDKTKLKAPILRYYDVKVETLLPTTLTYKVLAEDAHQAADLIKNKQPNSVHYRLHGRKDIKLTVYEAGSALIKFMKNLFGMR